MRSRKRAAARRRRRPRAASRPVAVRVEQGVQVLELAAPADVVVRELDVVARARAARRARARLGSAGRCARSPSDEHAAARRLRGARRARGASARRVAQSTRVEQRVRDARAHAEPRLPPTSPRLAREEVLGVGQSRLTAAAPPRRHGRRSVRRASRPCGQARRSVCQPQPASDPQLAAERGATPLRTSCARMLRAAAVRARISARSRRRRRRGGGRARRRRRSAPRPPVGGSAGATPPRRRRRDRSSKSPTARTRSGGWPCSRSSTSSAARVVRAEVERRDRRHARARTSAAPGPRSAPDRPAEARRRSGAARRRLDQARSQPGGARTSSSTMAIRSRAPPACRCCGRRWGPAARRGARRSAPLRDDGVRRVEPSSDDDHLGAVVDAWPRARQRDVEVIGTVACGHDDRGRWGGHRVNASRDRSRMGYGGLSARPEVHRRAGLGRALKLVGHLGCGGLPSNRERDDARSHSTVCAMPSRDVDPRLPAEHRAAFSTDGQRRSTSTSNVGRCSSSNCVGVAGRRPPR